MGDTDLRECDAAREEEKAMIVKKSFVTLVTLGILCMGLLSGCGTPSSDSPAPDPGPGPVSPVPANIVLQVSSSLLNSDGASTVTLTATVKDKDNVAVEGSKVSFTADSGLLTIINGTTGVNGTAMATLGTGGDPANRLIHLTASTGSVRATNTVTVTATALPTAPTGLTVTAATSTQIDLSWAASAGVAGYRIYRDGTYLKSVTVTSASDMGLTVSMPYCYAVSSYDSKNNESARTSPLCATTYGPPPAVPAGLTASAVSPTKVDLSWTASAGAAQYKIYRNGALLGTSATASYSDTTVVADTQYGYTVTAIDAMGSESAQSAQSSANTGLTVPSAVMVTAATSTQINLSWTASTGAAGYKIYRNGAYIKSVTVISASDAGLTASTTYCYAVSAYNATNNESARTGQLCAATYGPPPAVPAGVTVSAVSPTEVDLSWTASAGAAQYKIYRNGVLLGTSTTASYSDMTAAANTQYSYTVTAIDATGSESSQSAQSSANTGLTVPSNVLPTANSSSQITVTWTNSGGVNVRGYKVYQNGTQLGTVATTAIVSGGLAAKSQYCYTVSATDSAGNESARSGMACTNVFAPPPATPTNLTTSAVSPTKVDLSWTASTGAIQYRIYRNEILLTSTAATSYSDTSAAANTQYSYAVAAVDDTGSESGKSTPSLANTGLTVPTLAVAVNSTLQTTLTLADTGGAVVSGFNLYKGGLLMASVAKTTTSIVDSGLTANTQYCYAASAIDGSGKESAKSGSVCAITNKPAPVSPTNLTATAAGATQINLSWTASAGAAQYKVYRNGAQLQLGTLTTTSATDTELTANTQYCYTVAAFDVDGNGSPQTSQKCATTDVSAPPTPTALTAAAVSATQVDLTWTGSAVAKGYKVYRNDVILGSVPETTTSVSDMAGVWSSTLPPSTHMQYCYSVSAFGIAGNESPRSAAVCLATP